MPLEGRGIMCCSLLLVMGRLALAILLPVLLMGPARAHNANADRPVVQWTAPDAVNIVVLARRTVPSSVLLSGPKIQDRVATLMHGAEEGP
jgi:hypothetical protein